MLEFFESAKVAMILLAESAKITPAFVNGGKAEFPPFSLVGKFKDSLLVRRPCRSLTGGYIFVKFLLELPVAKFGREAFADKFCEFGGYGLIVFSLAS